jgi:uncharacterized RDD family membrane protein YckC/uncharacterized membrane protein SpoIIM required for sporulation
VEPGPPPLDTVREFATPEHIAFRFRLAGPAARAMAWLLDIVIRVVVLVVVCFVAGLIFGITGMDGFANGVILLSWFAIDWLSGALCEWLWNGQTPGKRAMDIRVIGTDGLPAGFAACMIRNLLRWADWLPAGFLAGLLSMAWSRDFQRLGDLAGGTLVVHAQSRPHIRASAPDPAARELAEQLPPEILGLLDGGCARAIAGYVACRRRFCNARRQEIAARLAKPLSRRLGLDTDPDRLLCALHHLLFGATAQARGSMAGRAALMLERRRPDWLKLERLMPLPDQGPDAEARALKLSELYRSACADLALAEAYHLPVEEVDRIHELVAHAHLRFYNRTSVGLAKLKRMVLVEVPGRLYGDPCLRIALVAFFGVFVISLLLGIWSPALVETFVGSEELNNLDNMYHDTGTRTGDMAAKMGGFYINHNVGIAFSCFASGIFAGIGSLVWLVFNGIFIGLIFGHFVAAPNPAHGNFLTFVTAHGPFELTGIALSGAAGLRLGLGMIDRRGLPWSESLRRAAGAATPIMGVAAVLVACAAPIEASISPSDLPPICKQAVGLTCAVIVLLYLVGLGRLHHREMAAIDAEAEAASVPGHPPAKAHADAPAAEAAA